MDDLIIMVEEAAEGGYTARAIGGSILTHGHTVSELRYNVRDAVATHFQGGGSPKTVRLQFLREEVLVL